MCILRSDMDRCGDQRITSAALKHDVVFEAMSRVRRVENGVREGTGKDRAARQRQRLLVRGERDLPRSVCEKPRGAGVAFRGVAALKAPRIETQGAMIAAL